jgi:hypothetical protein
VRILFVGEAPPASGRFFYQGDSGLYRAVRETFIAAFPSMPKDDFLNSFRASVERAQTMAGWSGLHLEVPYPGQWKQHREEFRRQLVPMLLKLSPLQLHDPDMQGRK